MSSQVVKLVAVPGDSANSQESVDPFRESSIEHLGLLGLEAQRQQLDRDGYTVVEGALDDAFVETLRTRCTGAMDALGQDSAFMLLQADPIFAQALLHPVAVAMAEYTCGTGCIVSQVASVRKRQLTTRTSATDLPPYADMALHRDPYPAYSAMMTATLTLDEWTPGAGPSVVHRGSATLRRGYSKLRDTAERRAITCPRGSIVIWDGAVHHEEAPRSLPGERVSLHLTYTRAVYRPYEDYRDIQPQLVAEHGEVMAGLLGANDPFGKNTPRGHDRSKMGYAVRVRNS